MPNKRWFILAVALQVILLLSMAGRHAYTLRSGQSVLLETQPVDPWEVFRGEYVQLSYKISRLSQGDVSVTGWPYRQGQRVWVTLRPGTPFHTAAAISYLKPEITGKDVLVSGIVQWTSPEMQSPTPGEPGKPGEVFIRYGIEQFYVPEGQGRELERSQQRLTVEARVDQFGRAALSRVFLDGEEIRWQ